MTDPAQIGRRIRELRKKQGKSQEELGLMLGKSHAAVSDFERGKTDIGINDLNAVAKALETSVSELLSEDTVAPSVSFVHYRDSKDITPEEKEAADKMAREFIKLARGLKEKDQSHSDDITSK